MLYDLQRLLHTELCFTLLCWIVTLVMRFLAYATRDVATQAPVASPIGRLTLRYRRKDFVGDVVSILIVIVLLQISPLYSFTVDLIADLIFAWPALMGLVMCVMMLIRFVHVLGRRAHTHG